MYFERRNAFQNALKDCENASPRLNPLGLIFLTVAIRQNY